MSAVFSIIFPVFAIVLLGYAAGYWNIMPQESSSIICDYLFNFSMPFLTFANIVKADRNGVWNTGFALSYLCAFVIVFALQVFFHKFIFKESGQPLILLCLPGFYGNVAYMGIPFLSLVLSSIIPMIFVLFFQNVIIFPIMIFLLDFNKEIRDSFSIKNLIGIAIRNPLILSAFFALIVLFLNIRLPHFFIRFCEMAGSPASAAGLFALGLSFSSAKSTGAIIKISPRILVSSLAKTILFPALSFLFGRYIFHIDSWWFTALMIISMLPTAMNIFIVSQRYHVREQESRAIILLTTLIFSITITVYLWTAGIA